MIKIAVIEDDNEYRSCLMNYLDSQIDLECKVGSGSVEEFINILKSEENFDLLFTDLELPGMSGISGIKLFKEINPALNIIVLSIHDDTERIFPALRSGASGYLLKDTAFSDLNSFIDMLYHGGAPMSHQIALKVIEFFHPKKKAKLKSMLSVREKEIALNLIEGLSYREIAELLCISVGTVHTHIRNIYDKLHIHSKAELFQKSYLGEI